MAQKHILVDFKFDGGIDFKKIGWPLYRELMERLVKSLAAMPDGPSVSNLLPLSATEGSLNLSIRMPSNKVGSVRHLAGGHPGGAPLQHYLRDRGWTASATLDGKEQKFEIPDSGSDWTLTERGCLRGVVTVAGMKTGRVWLQTDDGHGRVVCQTGRALAADIGKYLYQRMELEGLITREATTDEIRAFAVDGFRVLGQVSADDLERLLELDMAEIELGDPDEFIEEIG